MTPQLFSAEIVSDHLVQASSALRQSVTWPTLIKLASVLPESV